MTSEFDLNKVYDRKMTKKELLELISNTFDKEFIVVFLAANM